MKTSRILFLLVLFSTCTFAQSKDDGQELIDTFFDYYKKKSPEFALKYAFNTNKWIEVQGDEMNNIIIKLTKEVNSMGEYLGYEQIKSRSLGSRLRISSYLVYYLRDPIRFTFELYKTNTGWEISNFVFDTAFDEELEESMRITASDGVFR